LVRRFQETGDRLDATVLIRRLGGVFLDFATKKLKELLPMDDERH
jgi:hypothetical protein